MESITDQQGRRQNKLAPNRGNSRSGKNGAAISGRGRGTVRTGANESQCSCGSREWSDVCFCRRRCEQAGENYLQSADDSFAGNRRGGWVDAIWFSKEGAGRSAGRWTESRLCH